MEYAKGLIEGEEQIPIATIRTFSVHHMAELSTEKLEDYIQVENESLHRATAWCTEHIISFCLYSTADPNGDVFFSTCDELVKLDEATDGNDKVTVEEVTTVFCRHHLERELVRWVYLGIAGHALPLLGIMAAMVAVPPLGALAFRRTRAYWLKRQAEKAAQESEPSD